MAGLRARRAAARVLQAAWDLHVWGPMPDLVPADADEAFVVPHIAMMHVHLQILDAWHVAGDIEEVD